MTETVSINKQSSIRIAGSRILYFDPLEIPEAVHDADVIFITHDHYDHFSPGDIGKLKKEGTILTAPEQMRSQVLKESGIPEKNCVFTVPGTSYEISGLSVETVPAYNRLKPFHPKGKKWCGYIVTLDGIRYYISGDTDAIKEAEAVLCDVALVPIGGTFTMDAAEAAKLVSKMKPKTVIPTHYGSIVGSPEDGEIFRRLLQEKCPDIQVEFKL